MCDDRVLIFDTVDGTIGRRVEGSLGRVVQEWVTTAGGTADCSLCRKRVGKPQDIGPLLLDGAEAAHAAALVEFFSPTDGTTQTPRSDPPVSWKAECTSS